MLGPGRLRLRLAPSKKAGRRRGQLPASHAARIGQATPGMLAGVLGESKWRTFRPWVASGCVHPGARLARHLGNAFRRPPAAPRRRPFATQTAEGGPRRWQADKSARARSCKKCSPGCALPSHKRLFACTSSSSRPSGWHDAHGPAHCTTGMLGTHSAPRLAGTGTLFPPSLLRRLGRVSVTSTPTWRAL